MALRTGRDRASRGLNIQTVRVRTTSTEHGMPPATAPPRVHPRGGGTITSSPNFIPAACQATTSEMGSVASSNYLAP